MKRKSNEPVKKELTDEDLGQLFRRLHTLDKRIVNEHLDFSYAMEIIQFMLDSKPLSPKSLTPSPRSQLGTARMLNRMFGWGISEGLFQWVERGAPSKWCLEKLSPTQAVVLDISLPTFEKSFTTAWSLIEASHSQLGCTSDRKPVDVRSFVDGPYPGVSLDWVILDFGANTGGKSVEAVRKGSAPNPLPHTSILWAFVYNPELLWELHEMSIHRIWMGGCQFSGENPNIPVLFLDTQSNVLEFGTGCSFNETPKRTIPEFVARPLW